MSESKHIYIVYKTTNLVNQKIYIGVHKQKFFFPILFDGYLGSGKDLKKAIKKYGEENFIRETLFVFYNKKEAFAKEAELVNEAFVKRKDTYNLCTGGRGDAWKAAKGKVSVKDDSGKIFRISVLDERYISGELKQANCGIKRSIETRSKHSEQNRRRWANPENRKKRSRQQRKIMSERPDILCEYCGKYICSLNYHKWHGEKCKENPNFDPASRNIPKFECEHCGGFFDAGNFKQHHGEKCQKR